MFTLTNFLERTKRKRGKKNEKMQTHTRNYTKDLYPGGKDTTLLHILKYIQLYGICVKRTLSILPRFIFSPCTHNTHIHTKISPLLATLPPPRFSCLSFNLFFSFPQFLFSLIFVFFSSFLYFQFIFLIHLFLPFFRPSVKRNLMNIQHTSFVP